MATATERKRSQRGKGEPPSRPVLRVTAYDRVSSLMLALVAALLGIVLALSILYQATVDKQKQDVVPVEFVSLAGGYEDGSPDEELSIEAPEEVLEETQVDEALESVVELSDLASQQVQQQFQMDSQLNDPNAKRGKGGRPLGMGGGQGGLAREQRWFVQFDDRGTLDEYARQLDFFGITMGALMEGDKRELIVISNLAAAKPTRQSVTKVDENRLYMTWQGGNRKTADLKLFRKAGVNLKSELILHFYPPQTEQLLAQVEQAASRKPVDKIRRTYFVVRPEGNGYKFVVSRQSYYR